MAKKKVVVPAAVAEPEKCARCGKPKPTLLSTAFGTKFCSEPCLEAAHKASEGKAKTPTSAAQKCPCGKMVSFYSDKLSRGFCSDACYREAALKANRPEPVKNATGWAPTGVKEVKLGSLPLGARFTCCGPTKAETQTGTLLDSSSASCVVRLDRQEKKTVSMTNRNGVAVEFEVTKQGTIRWSPDTAVVFRQEIDFEALQERENRLQSKSEEATMAKKTSKKAAVKNGEGAGHRVDLAAQEVKLIAMPKEEDKVRGNQLAILEVLKDNGKKLTAADLVKKLKTPTKNKNGQLAVWTFNRPILIQKGFIAVS